MSRRHGVRLASRFSRPLARTSAWELACARNPDLCCLGARPQHAAIRYRTTLPLFARPRQFAHEGSCVVRNMRDFTEHRMRSTVLIAALALPVVAYLNHPRIEADGDAADPIACGAPVPSCACPAPLYGKFDSWFEDFIVVFRDGVNVTRETARLEQVYNFRATTVMSSTQIRGFSAVFDDEVRDRLRCEPSVDHVSYEASGPRCGFGRHYDDDGT